MLDLFVFIGKRKKNTIIDRAECIDRSKICYLRRHSFASLMIYSNSRSALYSSSLTENLMCRIMPAKKNLYLNQLTNIVTRFVRRFAQTSALNY